MSKKYIVIDSASNSVVINADEFKIVNDGVNADKCQLLVDNKVIAEFPGFRSVYPDDAVVCYP